MGFQNFITVHQRKRFMAEYESFSGKPCYAADFNSLASKLTSALSARGISASLPSVSVGGLMYASQIEALRSAAYNAINYSSFIGQITAGMQIKHEQLECISQAVSDLNNLLRCRSGCTGNCHSACTGACTSSCAGSVHHSGSCSYMTWWCSGDCNNTCSGGCSGSCSGTCGRGCSNYCVSSCKNSSISETNRLTGTYVYV